MIKSQKLAYLERACLTARVFSLECPLPCIRIMQVRPSSNQHDMNSDMRKLSSFEDLYSSMLTLYPILYCSCKDQNFQVYSMEKRCFETTLLSELYSLYSITVSKMLHYLSSFTSSRFSIIPSKIERRSLRTSISISKLPCSYEVKINK